MEEVAEEQTANGDSSDSSGEDEAHFSKYDSAETWNDTDDTVLPNKPKDIGMVVATRKGEEKILVNRAVYDTALAIIESMIEASFVMPSGVEDAGEALEGDAFIDFVAPKVSVTQWFHLNPKTCDVFRAGIQRRLHLTMSLPRNHQIIMALIARTKGQTPPSTNSTKKTMSYRLWMTMISSE